MGRQVHLGAFGALNTPFSSLAHGQLLHSPPFTSVGKHSGAPWRSTRCTHPPRSAPTGCQHSRSMRRHLASCRLCCYCSLPCGMARVQSTHNPWTEWRVAGRRRARLASGRTCTRCACRGSVCLPRDLCTRSAAALATWQMTVCLRPQCTVMFVFLVPASLTSCRADTADGLITARSVSKSSVLTVLTAASLTARF